MIERTRALASDVVRAPRGVLRSMRRNAPILRWSVNPRLAAIGRGRPGGERGSEIILCAPLPVGSLGDEASILGAVTAIREREPDARVLVAQRFSDGRPIWPIGDGALDITAWMESGRRRGVREHLDRIARARCSVTLGNDMADGTYGARHALVRLGFVELAGRLGTPSRCCGISVAPVHDARIRSAMRRAARVGQLVPRDIASAARAARIVGRPLEVAPDPAFALVPDPLSAPAASWFADQRGRLVVGVNISLHASALMDVERVEAALVTICESSNHDVSLVAIGHDGREHPNDFDLSNRAVTRAAARTGVPHHVVDDSLTAAQAKALAGACDYVITSRMHLAIAAFSSGTPALCLSYGPKFAGLCATYGIENAVIDAADVSADRLRTAALEGIDDRGAVGQRLAALATSEWARSRVADGLLGTRPGG